MSSPNAKQTQYQHFIPQFILRKFSDFIRPRPTGDEKADTRKLKRAKDKARVNLIDLSRGYDKGHIEDRKTGNVFGIQNMYSDTTPRCKDVDKIEKQLSKLEAEASKIITHIEGQLELGHTEFDLTRPDKDTLRRFLFIMLYRNRTLSRRFFKDSDDYDSPDRRNMLDYMEQRGFATPKEVWLSNLSCFLDEPIDSDSAKCFTAFQHKAYPADAQWFCKHMNQSFLAFCTPENSSDEFILTENAYGIFEGPNSELGWMDWHVFAPLSPKILIIMRTNMLQPVSKLENPELDHAKIAGINEQLRKQVDTVASQFEDPEAARSWLIDLPITRPKPSYQVVEKVSGNPVEASSHTRLAKSDIFTFKFFPLSPSHLNRIHSIFLEEAIDTDAIVFKTTQSLHKTIEGYLTLPDKRFKLAYSHTHAKLYQDYVEISSSRHRETSNGREPREYRRVAYLEMLEGIVAGAGSSTKAIYEMTIPRTVEILPPLSKDFSRRYTMLAYSNDIVLAILYDYSQAHAITKLVTSTDRMVHEWNLDQSVAAVMRQNRRAFIYSLPPARVWLHLRILRVMTRLSSAYHSGRRDLLRMVVNDNNSGPEDALIDGTVNRKQLMKELILRTAYEVFRPEDFSRIMSCAFHLSAKNKTAIQEPIEQIIDRTILYVGSVMRCGIPSLEEAAKEIFIKGYSPSTRRIASNSPAIHCLDEDLQHELCVRIELATGFQEVLRSQLSKSIIQALASVFFGVLFPAHMV